MSRLFTVGLAIYCIIVALTLVASQARAQYSGRPYLPAPMTPPIHCGPSPAIGGLAMGTFSCR